MDVGYDLHCSKCNARVQGGLRGFKNHLRRADHLPPFVCGQEGCCFDFMLRPSLYDHIRVHHPIPPVHLVNVNPLGVNELDLNESFSSAVPSVAGREDQSVDDDVDDRDADQHMSVEETLPSVNLAESAERAVLKLRSITYMTSHAVEVIENQALTLMQDTAEYLKDKVQDYVLKVDKTELDHKNLLEEFSLLNPFKHIKTKKQQMKVFQEKYGLLLPQEIFLGHRFDSRQNPNRPNLESRQVPMSFQYISIKDILKAVLSDPSLRNIVLNEKTSTDGYMRSFRDGSLFQKVPADLKNSIRIVIYVDDLEILQALSPSAGMYKIAGIYFGIQNFPAELNSLLTFVFVTALAFAGDAKNERVWEPFLHDMQELETNGIDILVDGELVNFKAMLVAQIGDSLAAAETLGFRHPAANCFCRLCYISRGEMWADGLKVGELRNPVNHAADVAAARVSEANRKATGVDGPSLLHGFRFFETAGHSVFDIFHDLLQGVNKMEIKLALRHYICVKKYFSISDLKSRIQFFDLGSPDKKNRPTTNFTEDYLRKIDTYNLHQSGAQMWCLTRIFPFLFADLVPDDDPFMELISLLNQAMRILFSRVLCDSNITNLDNLTKQHHTLFMQIFPGRPEGNVDGDATEPGHEDCDDPADEEREQEERQNQGFVDFQEDSDDEDVEVVPEVVPDPVPQQRRKRPKIIRMLNKHHHWLHFCDLIRRFGPLVLFWCARYEARHFLFKLIATVSHNHRNVLKTLMEMLQMKLAADKQEQKSYITVGKQGTKLISVTSSGHCEELKNAGLDEFAEVFHVTKKIVCMGVELRPHLFVVEELEKVGTYPKFGRIEGIYVSSNQETVYLITKQWKTLRFDAKYCAFEVQPDGSAGNNVKQPEDLASYRPLSLWKRYDSNKLYLAPRTVA